MSLTWAGGTPPEPARLGPRAWLRIVVRGAPILGMLALCFPLLLLLRLPERALFGAARPMTPFITQAVCIVTCALLRIRRSVEGRVDADALAFVSNHASWLDIFVLNAGKRLYFVAKAEVRGWAGIGWLARGTGTVFINRRRGEARDQTRLLRDRMAAGHRLLVFPEGTSTDGRRVVPFRPTLFAAFLDMPGPSDLKVQPVSVIYHAPEGQDRRVYGWWGDMEFGPHLLQVLALPGQGRVTVVYHAALNVAEFADRKALALAAETAVRDGLAARLS